MGVLESREAIQHAIDTGTNEEGAAWGQSQIAAFQRLLEMPNFDELTIEERRAAFDNLRRGFQPATAASAPGGDTVALMGWLMLIAGILASLGSLVMKVSVNSTTDSSFIGDTYIPAVTSNVINIGLLQNQMMVFQAGLALAIGGMMMLAAAAVRNALVVNGARATS